MNAIISVLIFFIACVVQCDLVPTCLQCPQVNLSTIDLLDPFPDLQSKLLVQVTSKTNAFEYRVSLSNDTDRFFSLRYSSIGEASSALNPILCPLLTSLPALQDVEPFDESTTVLNYKLKNCANFQMETTMFNQSETIEVAGESLNLSESSNKLSFTIDNWLFSPLATSLNLNLRLSFQTSNTFNVTMEELDGQKILFFTESDETIWTFRLLKKVEVDGQIANCTINLSNVILDPFFQADISFSFPKFTRLLRYDPDWGVLMPQSGPAEGTTSTTKTSTSASSTYFDFPGDTSSEMPSSEASSNEQQSGSKASSESSSTADTSHTSSNVDPTSQSESASQEDLHDQSSSASSFFTPLTIGIIAVIAGAIIAIIIGFTIVHFVVRKRRRLENAALGLGNIRHQDFQEYTPPQTQRSSVALLIPNQ
eukprot:TRINITY_DN7997_c0_g1_i1.p1 TRINITY_DN7997_c0_g1~~TRINITY_DN7997_c0_g1_i1.p1  ORF type:complete len:424 (+),score=83.37 TRINITY_DN7997_c0_g1_i1:35-1306(+)